MWKKEHHNLDDKTVKTARKLAQTIRPTGVERFFEKNELIVSKTDLKGNLTYVNEVFLRISSFEEKDLLGQPHSIIRHPEMPRVIFKLLWDSLKAGKELFAYVNNLSANGDNYWVFAHVTPSKDVNGDVVGYHSNRRVPDTDILESKIVPLYKSLLDIEKTAVNRKAGLIASQAKFDEFIQEQGVSYDEFILSL